MSVAPAINLGQERQKVQQLGRTFALTLGVTPVPIDPSGAKEKLITTFVVNNYLNTTNNPAGLFAFLGFDAGVTTSTGFEIAPGGAPAFEILQEGRQLYELQEPFLNVVADMQSCRTQDLKGIPFVVWDLSQVFMVSTAALTVSITTFQAMYL